MNDSFEVFWKTVCDNHPEFDKEESEAVKLRIRGIKLLAKLAWMNGFDSAISVIDCNESTKKSMGGGYNGSDIFSQMFGGGKN